MGIYLAVVSLESVGRVFSELQNERNWVEREMDKVFKEKVQINFDIKDTDRAIEELQQKKADLESRLAKTLQIEADLKIKSKYIHIIILYYLSLI